MTERAWIDAALRSARPRVMGALLRYFRELDSAEEAYQEACLSALALANTAADAAHIRLHLDRLCQEGGAADRTTKVV